MLYEDETIGVIVLASWAGCFSEDELRYLSIYASIAAQAIVNADISQRLQPRPARSIGSYAARRSSCA